MTVLPCHNLALPCLLLALAMPHLQARKRRSHSTQIFEVRQLTLSGSLLLPFSSGGGPNPQEAGDLPGSGEVVLRKIRFPGLIISLWFEKFIYFLV